MQLVNYASWLPLPQSRLEVGVAPFPSSLPDTDLIIKNHAVAINPVDWKIQTSGGPGFNIPYPFILGEDVAGEVLEVGKTLQAKGLFKPGDRVIAHALGLGGGAAYGGFQLYPTLKGATVAKIPDVVPFDRAVVLPLSISTAAAGLYLKANLGLRFPKLEKKSSHLNSNSNPILDRISVSKKQALLLWGGSSSVGSSVVQLGVASGYSVVATASPSNYDYVKSLGASLVLDYHNPDIVSILISLLRDSTVVGVYDAIGSDSTVRQSAAVLHALGGGVIASVVSAPDDLPKNVKVTRIGSGNIVSQEDGLVARKVWGEYLPKALEEGVLKPRPKEMLVPGRGLYFVQAGLDAQKEGVSAKKVVVEL